MVEGERAGGKEEGRRKSVAMEVFTSLWVSVSNLEIWRLELIIIVLPFYLQYSENLRRVRLQNHAEFYFPKSNV